MNVPFTKSMIHYIYKERNVYKLEEWMMAQKRQNQGCRTDQSTNGRKKTRRRGSGLEDAIFQATWDELADVGYARLDRKSTRLNSSHVSISYAVFCLKKKKYDSEQRSPGSRRDPLCAEIMRRRQLLAGQQCEK